MPDSSTVAIVFPSAARAASRTFSYLFSPTRFHEEPVLITEAARKEILQRYPSSFAVNFVRNRSLIAADTDYRRDVYEAILTSYPLS